MPKREKERKKDKHPSVKREEDEDDAVTVQQQTDRTGEGRTSDLHTLVLLVPGNSMQGSLLGSLNHHSIHYCPTALPNSIAELK